MRRLIEIIWDASGDGDDASTVEDLFEAALNILDPGDTGSVESMSSGPAPEDGPT